LLIATRLTTLIPTPLPRHLHLLHHHQDTPFSLLHAPSSPTNVPSPPLSPQNHPPKALLRRIRPLLHLHLHLLPRLALHPVLADISLYLPAHELTFIVGSSGSGKSTIAQLLLGMYLQRGGTVLLEDTELRYLNPRGDVCGVGQGMGDVVLEGKSILENDVGSGGCDGGDG
jgi:ABC-type microcin C transport system duplicated ATPase subunit YejF